MSIQRMMVSQEQLRLIRFLLMAMAFIMSQEMCGNGALIIFTQHVEPLGKKE